MRHQPFVKVQHTFLKAFCFSCALLLLSSCSNQASQALEKQMHEAADGITNYKVFAHLKAISTENESVDNQDILSQATYAKDLGIEGKMVNRYSDERQERLLAVIDTPKGTYFSQRKIDGEIHWQQSATKEGQIDQVMPFPYMRMLDIIDKLSGKWDIGGGVGQEKLRYKGVNSELTSIINAEVDLNFKDKPEHDLAIYVDSKTKRIKSVRWEVRGFERMMSLPTMVTVSIEYNDFNRQNLPSDFANESKILDQGVK